MSVIVKVFEADPDLNQGSPCVASASPPIGRNQGIRVDPIEIIRISHGYQVDIDR